MMKKCSKILLLISMLAVNVCASKKRELPAPSYFDLATKSRYFVDKTMLLKDIVQIEDRYITAPNNFGKSTNLEMIRRFFEHPHINATEDKVDRKASLYYKLFTNKSLNLVISKEDEFIEQHFGNYHIIYMDFNRVNGTTQQQIIESTREVIVKAIAPYENVYDTIYNQRILGWHTYEDLLADYESSGGNIFQNEAKGYEEFCSSLEFVLGYIYRHLRQVITLIDNYDNPVMQALSRGENATDINDFMGRMTTVSSKYLIILGVHRRFVPVSEYAKCNYFLDSDNDISEYFGFTETEVDQLLGTNKFNNDDRTKIKQYFDGYNSNTQSKSSLYHPQAILQYLKTNKFEDLDYTSGYFISKIMKCLRHQQFFTNITRLLMKQGILVPSNNTFGDFNLPSTTEIIQNNCSELPRHFTFGLAYLMDNGYGTWSSKNRANSIQIPNLVMENRLKSEFLRFYDEWHGINMVNTRVASSIQSILNSKTTSDDMISSLSQSLEEVLETKLTKGFFDGFEFKSIIVGALYCNVDSYRSYVKIKKTTQKTEARINNVDIFTMPNFHEKILLIVKITFNATLHDAVQGAREYVPQLPEDDNGISVVKYLGINLSKRNTIQVGKGENRKN